MAVLASLASSAVLAQVPYYRAKMLPVLPGEGWTLGVSLSDGTQVAGLTQTGRPVSWSFADGLTPLSSAGGALGVAATSGTMVGWSLNGQGRPESYLWSPGGTGQPLSGLYAGVPSFESIAHAVNDAGWVLISGRASIDDPYRLLLLRPQEDALDLGESATGLNWGGATASGIVASSVGVPGNATRGMTWTEAQGFRSFSVNGGDTFVEGANGNGWVVGRTLVPDAQGLTQTQGFLYDSFAGQTLRGWTGFMPRDVNNAGLVVGNLLDTGARLGQSAGAWSDGAVVNLNGKTAGLGLYELNQAVAVNAQGQILALGSLSAAGVASPPPGAQGLVTFLLSECTRCGQIAPYPNPAGNALNVGPDWYDAYNAVDFYNGGDLALAGNFLVNETGAIIRNGGNFGVNGGGALANDGTIINLAGGHLEWADGSAVNLGVVINHGIVVVGGDSVINLAGSGWLNEAGSTFVQSGNSSIVNTGYFDIDQAVMLQHGGQFTNGASGEFALFSGSALWAGRVDNQGGMFISDNLVESPGQPGQAELRGEFFNHSSGRVWIGDGSYLWVNGGSFDNSGVLELTGSATKFEVGNGGVLWLHAGGSDGAGRTTVNGGALLEVNGAALQQSADSELTIGAQGSFYLRKGAFAILAGQTFNSGAMAMGSGATMSLQGRLDNHGMLQIRGVGTELNVAAGDPADPDHMPFLFNADNGRIELSEGGVLRSAGRVNIYGETTVDNTSSILVEGGLFGVFGTVRGEGSLLQTDGKTYVLGEINLPQMTFERGALGGLGTLRGNVTIGSRTLADPDLHIIQPGNSPGTLTIDGDLTLYASTLAVEMNDGLAQDHLVVTGQLNLGELKVVLVPYAGYLPDLDDRFDFLRVSGGISGIDGATPLVTVDASALGGSWMQQLASTPTGLHTTLDNPDAVQIGDIADGELIRVDAGGIAYSRDLVLGGRLEVAGQMTHRVKVLDPDSGAALEQARFWINPSGQLAVLSGGTFSNRSELVNNGQIVNEGLWRNRPEALLVNNGSLHNAGTLRNDGVTTLNGGTTLNTGRWEERGRLEVMSFVQFNNQGELEVSGQVVNQGQILNTGSVRVANEGVLNNDYQGGILNHGEFRVSGTLNNNAQSLGTSFSTGSIHNQGIFAVEAGGWVSGGGTYFQDGATDDHPVITRVDGRLEASDISLRNGTLAGNGILAGPVTLGTSDGQGVAVRPGNSPGILTIDGNLTAYNTTFDIELAGTGVYDQLVVTGDAHFSGGWVNFLLHTPDGVNFDYQPALGDTFTWLTVGGVADGLESLGWSLVAVGDGWTSTLASSSWGPAGATYHGLSVDFHGNSIEFTTAPVPEPETYLMMLAGLGLVGWMARRRGVA